MLPLDSFPVAELIATECDGAKKSRSLNEHPTSLFFFRMDD